MTMTPAQAELLMAHARIDAEMKKQIALDAAWKRKPLVDYLGQVKAIERQFCLDLARAAEQCEGIIDPAFFYASAKEHE